MTSDAEFFAGVCLHDGGDDLDLLQSTGMEHGLIVFEVEGEAFAAARIGDDGGVGDAEAAGVLGKGAEDLREIDAGDFPRGGGGFTFEAPGR